METIVRKIVKLVADRQITKDEAKELLKDIQRELKNVDQEIAVIGMAGKFPESENLKEFWENLVLERKCMGAFSEYRRRDTDEIFKTYLDQQTLDLQSMYRQGGFLKQIDMFDHDFFGISAHEAALIEPAHRLFLEVAWEAIADAGLAGERLVGSNTGVFVGKDHFTEAIYKKLVPKSDILAATGSWPGILASRLAYIFDFRGPNMVVDAACSSGLVAVHQACQAIKNKECELAIAGGVFVEIVPAQGSHLGMMESPDATIRSFDKAANGTIWGEGVGAVLLKSVKNALADGDPIHAIIKSSAINNGGSSNGLTTPKMEVQEEVILKAWRKLKINPETISYVETHGSGTVFGDPIEFKGLANAFRHYTDKKQFCGIGSCKSNIGHLVGASGLAALIKVILSLKHKILPANLNFQEPNPYIDFSDSPLYVNDRLQEWQREGYPLRAGVSVFGFSGTNCHLILEEAPLEERFTSKIQRQLLTISAQSKQVLLEFIKEYRCWVEEHPNMNLANFCYTLNTGRGHFTHRLAFIVQEWEELKAKLLYIQNSGLKDDLAFNIFYAEHKIVRNQKNDRLPGELTKAEQRELNIVATEYVKELRETGEKRNEVAKIYVQGADLNWDELYRGQVHQRLHLPTYPFARTRHWLELEVSPTSLERSQNDGLMTVVEARLAVIWQDLLEVQEISREDNFFELGGHSLKATQLIIRLTKEYGVQLTLQEIFCYPLLKDLAEQIEAIKADFLGNETKESLLAYQEISTVKEADYYEISYAQKRLWYLFELKPNSSAYNLPGQIVLKERVDFEQIVIVLNRLIQRHESFRTYFTLVDGQVVQKIAEQLDFQLSEIDLSNFPEDQREQRRDELFLGEVNKPFDLRTPPLFRAIFVKLDVEHYELIFAQHHIISDGWSTEILRQEFAAIYEGIKVGHRAELPPLEINYKDFAAWQNRLFKDSVLIEEAKNFWLEQLSVLKPLQLPKDYLLTTDDRQSAAAYRTVIPLEVQQGLLKLAHESSTSLFTVLLASFELFLAGVCSQNYVKLGIPIAGRDHKGLENVVGFFVNTTIASIDINPNESFIHHLKRVKEQWIQMLTYQSYPLELIVDELRINYPKISVFFNLLNMGQRRKRFLRETESYHISSVSEVKFPLTCYLQEYQNGIDLRCHYLSSLFKPETIEVLFKRYQEILAEILKDPNKAVADYARANKQRELF